MKAAIALQKAVYSALAGNITYNSELVPVYSFPPSGITGRYIIANIINSDDSPRSQVKENERVNVSIMIIDKQDGNGGSMKAVLEILASVLELIRDVLPDTSSGGFNTYIGRANNFSAFPERVSNENLIAQGTTMRGILTMEYTIEPIT